MKTRKDASALEALTAFLRQTELTPSHPMNAESVFAWRARQAIPYRAFADDWQAARTRLAALPESEIVLFTPDAYHFIVWLLAAWSCCKRVILPNDDLPATRRNLPLPWIGAEWKPPEETVVAASPAGSVQDSALQLFTSGSSGQPSRIDKTISQLVREVRTLEAAFGADLAPDTRFVASVPHQHMFGLPFAIFWPLTSGRPLVVEKVLYPEQLPALPPAAYVFISAPTFLKHLDAPLPEAAPIFRQQTFQLVVAAGSPLPAATRSLTEEKLAAPVLEIYGSTETGAVAGRLDSTRFWRILPGVRLELERESRRLRIHSPFLAGKEAETGFLSQDIARLEDGRLEILGRADRIVKIGEKRISLTQIETALTTLPEVERAAVLLLEDASERGTLGAVVALSDAGRQALAKQGKARFDLALKTRLRPQLDPLALPRRWRYPDAFPVNTMGKTTQHELNALFAPKFPLVRNASTTTGPEDVKTLTLALTLPPGLLWFQGHFPDLPVLPGVVQLDWVAHFAALHFGCDPATSVFHMPSVKFQHLLRPGDMPELCLTLKPQTRELTFTYRLADKICARGIWRLEVAA
ncbi:MAG: AMP-binding protein [Zoogloeaceae bacterium]|jgi:3-hydroxymyristoyl/3-hydroxydecanoyl-(acyl carrier protein) dehydratase|nr:AMP-binding protein [Zoogloeaceae bacterium]